MLKLFGITIFLGLLASITASSHPLNSSTYILLEKKTAGGYVMPEHQGWESGIIITVSGKVSGYYKQSHQHQTDYFPLGNLNTASLDMIHRTLESLPEHEELQFPNVPICADAPWTEYKAWSSYEKTFAATRQCRDGLLKDFYKGKNLKNLLDGYDALFRLMRQ